MSTAEILGDPNLIAKTVHTVLGANIKKLKHWVIILSILLILVIVCTILSSMIGVYLYIIKKKDTFESIRKYDDENNENNKYI